MQEALAQIVSYILGVWRHRWVALIVAWIIALVGWLYVWRLPEYYVATARVHVDTNTVLGPMLRGLAITPDTSSRIALLSRTLLSRPNMEQLARMTDMDLYVTTEAQKEALIRRLQDSVTLRGDRNNRSLYSISVTDGDRDRARLIAQSLITIFIETSMSDKREDSFGAQTFLEQQLAESEQRLIEAENRLARFKQENANTLPGQGGDYYSRLRGTQNDLAQAQLQLREAEFRRAELERQILGEEPIFTESNAYIPGVAQTPHDARLNSLRARLDELLSRYTTRHPEVARLQTQIAELEQERADALANMRRQAGPSPIMGLNSNPVYQNIRSMLAQAEAQVAELSVRVAEYEQRVEDLSAKVHQIPEIEAQMKQLDRDYNVIARQHQQMLERRESVRLSGDVQSNVGEVNFRLIDPPFVPGKPSKPNKLLLNGGVLVVSLGGGFAFAFLLTLLNPMVTDPRMLGRTTGLPVLGTVTFNRRPEEKRQEMKQLAVFGLCGAALLLTFAGIAFWPGLGS